ncbi:MAG: hypothetical protein V3G42_13650 [Oscillospiraceae bacterium]
MYAYFKKLGLNVTPLIGQGEREKYIYQVAEWDKKYLKPEYSEYLTAPCLLAGMVQNVEKSPDFGKEPCKNLKRNGRKYTCPYLDICPAVKMHRDIFDANIIITTVQGLAAIRILGENRLFLEYVLEQADLVIFDECDKAQKTLDEFFTPSTDFAKFMRDNADDCAKDMKQETDKLDNMGSNALHYTKLRLQSLSMSQRVRESIQSMTDSWKSLLENTFSAMTLYQQICEENDKYKLHENVLKVLETAMDEPKDEDFSDILDYALNFEYDSKFTEKLKKWLKKQDCEPQPELLQKIKLYLIVTQFDRYVHSLENSYSLLTQSHSIYFLTIYRYFLSYIFLKGEFMLLCKRTVFT